MFISNSLLSGASIFFDEQYVTIIFAVYSAPILAYIGSNIVFAGLLSLFTENTVVTLEVFLILKVRSALTETG